MPSSTTARAATVALASLLLALLSVATTSAQDGNSAPAFTSVPPPVADVGHDYRYDADAADADGDTLQFLLQEGPPGADLDAANGLLQWTPQDEHIGQHTVELRARDTHGAETAQTYTLRVLEDFCPIYPIALPRERIEPLVPGDQVDGMERGTGAGNFSWLTWAGAVDAPTLSTSLLPPGDSDTYVGPTDSTDTLLEIGDWAQGATGSMSANAVRASLDALLGQDIVLPVWQDRRGQGSSFDYAVWKFAIVRLSDYRLTGQGWISFEFRGYANCYNDPPFAHDQQLETLEDVALPIVLTGEDRDGDALTYALLDLLGNGTLSGESPELTYTPAVNHHGSDSFTFRVFDGEFWSKPATVKITVVPVNDAPIAHEQLIETPEDTAVAIVLTAEDVEGDPLTYIMLTQPQHGTLSGAAPELVYTPHENYFGADAFTFQANDAELASNPATVSITVTPMNDPPAAGDQSLETAEDTPLPLVLTARDVESDPLTYTVLTQPKHGTLSGAAPSLVYTPHENYFGADSFTFRASDAERSSNTATASIVVTAVNDPPSIQTDVLPEAEFGVDYEPIITAHDPDIDDVLAFGLLDAPEGMHIDAVSGQLHWPMGNQQPGEHVVLVRVSDLALASAQVALGVRVAACNATPVAHSQQLSTDEGVAIDLVLSATGSAGSPLTYRIVSDPAHGRIAGPLPALSYAPSAYFEGTDSFEFVATQNGVDSEPAVVSISISGGNNPPRIVTEPVTRHILVASSVEPVPQRLSEWTFVDLDFWANGVWAFTDNGYTAVHASNGNGTALISPETFSNVHVRGTWQTFNGDDDYMGTIFGYRNPYQFYWMFWKQNAQGSHARGMQLREVAMATDGSQGLPYGGAYEAEPHYANSIPWFRNVKYTYTIDYLPDQTRFAVLHDGVVVDAFVLRDNTYPSGHIGIFNASQPHTYYTVAVGDLSAGANVYWYELRAVDPEGDALQYRLLNAPSGMWINPSLGTIRWETSPEEAGAHDVTVEVEDEFGLKDTQQYRLIVSADGPVITSKAIGSVYAGQDYRYLVAAFDPTPAEQLEYRLLDGPADMHIDPATGEVLWPTLSNDIGQRTATIEVSDSTGLSDAQTFDITVLDPIQNTPPVFTSTPTTAARVGQWYRYTPRATDADGDPLQYGFPNAVPYHMQIFDGENITWLPGDDQVSKFEITVDARDGKGGVATQTFVIVVDDFDGNSPPEIQSTPIQSARVDQQYVYQVVAKDPDSDALSYRLDTAPEGMELDATGRITWTPSAADRAVHRIEVRALDSGGGYARQMYDLAVLAESDNRAPHISSTPVQLAETGAEYRYEVSASDSDGDPLAFSLGESPQGLSIDPFGGSISWIPTADQVGTWPVSVRVDDGRGGFAAQSWSITVSDGAGTGNHLPVISSTSPTSIGLGQHYAYPVIASDPDGDALAYVLTVFPAGMTIDPAGQVRWTPLPGQLGTHAVALAVSDGRGASATQSFTVTVANEGAGENRLPTIVSAPPAQAKASHAYTYAVDAFDADGDTLQYTLTTAPAGMSVDASGVIRWTPDAAGTASVVVRVDDGQAWVEQAWTITVVDVWVVFSGQVTVSPDPVLPGETITITLDADGAAGPIRVQATIDGMHLDLPADGILSVLAPETPGTHTVHVVISDGIDSVEITETFIVADGSDATPPLVQLLAPTEGAQEEILILTTAADVVGTVSDDNLLAWTLVLRERDSTATTVMAEGTGPITSETIARFDPTLLANGQYVLILQAWDVGGNTAQDLRPILVEGDLKVGQFSITFEDFSVPVAGIPVTVNRTYDTRRRAASLDFGHGWSVDYQNVRVQESRRPGYAWEMMVYPSGPLGSVPNYCMESALGNVVNVVLPDGAVEKFLAKATPECNQGLPLLDVSLVFEAMDGTHSRLEALNDANGRLINGSIADPGDPGRPIDPSRYRLTTAEGRQFTLDQGFGIREIHEPEGGNTITFDHDGITHSNGLSVQFVRDAGNRITQVIAPDGSALNYEYDTRGNLAAFVDAVGNRTTYTYLARLDHYLEDIVDPRGVRVARNEYDEQGRLIAVVDADENRIEYTHDLAGNTELVHDRLGNTTVYVYNDRGDVLAETNAEGETVLRTYDAYGNTLTETNALGEIRRWSYDAHGNVASETNPAGETTGYGYGAFNQLLTQTDPLGVPVFTNFYRNTTVAGVPIFPGPLVSITDANAHATGFGYDEVTGELERITDAAGASTHMAYDAHGYRIADIDALGHRTDYSNDAMGRVLSETRTRTRADGSTETLLTSYTLDEKGRVTATVHPDGSTTTTAYDGNDKPIRECDALDRCTVTTYDARGNAARTDYPDGTFETRAFDANGNTVAETDRAGRTTRHVYDAANRPIETILPDATPADDSDNPRTRTVYDAAGRLRQSIDANGHATRYGYDAAGRQVSVTDALGNTSATEYDAAGRRSATVDAEGHRTEYVYDAGGRLLETIALPAPGEGPASTRVEYDATGRKTAEIDAMGRTTRYGYDALGRLVTVVLPDPVTGANPPLVGGMSPAAGTLVTTYAYDEVGNKIAQTDAEGRTTRWEYDAMGRETARLLPEGQRETREYNAAGELVAHTDFNGQTTRYSYDAVGRLQTIDTPTDADTHFGYTPAGERNQVVDARGTSTRAFDQRARLVRATDADGASIEYQYDAAGNLLARVSPSQSLVYSYDAGHRLQSVTRSIDGEAPITTTYEYDRDGNRSAMQSGDGVRTEYAYDSRHRLRELVKRSAAGALMVAMAYSVDATGMRTAVEESDLAGITRSVAWHYDATRRLVEETIDHRDAWNDRQTAWTYDRVGNRLAQTRSIAGVVDTTSYTYDRNDRLLTEASTGGDTPGTTTYGYDANGNTVQRSGPQGTVDYTYDDANRLTTAAGPDGSTAYVYNADGLRVRKTHTPIGGVPTTTWYVQDSNYAYAQTIETYRSENGGPKQLEATFTFADDLVSQTRYGADGTPSTCFVHTDGFGSTRWLTDSAGTITDSVDYDAFGMEVRRSGTTAIEHLYRGEAFEPNVGFYNLRARWYGPDQGRFLTQDRFAGYGTDPISLHKYLYAHDNPTNGSDPSGLSFLATMVVDFGFSINGSTVIRGAGVKTGRSAFKRVLFGRPPEDLGVVGEVVLRSIEIAVESILGYEFSNKGAAGTAAHRRLELEIGSLNPLPGYTIEAEVFFDDEGSPTETRAKGSLGLDIRILQGNTPVFGIDLKLGRKFPGKKRREIQRRAKGGNEDFQIVEVMLRVI